MAENKILDTINEYGSEYIMPNEQAAQLKSSFASGGIISAADVSKIVNAYSSVGSGFSMGSNGVCAWSNPQKPVELSVESIINMHCILDAESQEKFIREELANRLARKMIEEDLITFYTDHDIDPETIKVRAKVKFIQE